MVYYGSGYTPMSAGVASQGGIELKHVPDPSMPADFLTKWMPDRAKLEDSIRYATNRRVAIARGHAALACRICSLTPEFGWGGVTVGGSPLAVTAS